MTVRGAAMFVSLVLFACGGRQPLAHTCDQLGRGWSPSTDDDVTREGLQHRCRAEAWKPAKISCVDRKGLDDTWQGLESSVEDIDYTQWSEGVGFDAPHVLLLRYPPNDAGETTVRVIVTNKVVP